MSGLDWLIARPVAHRGLHDAAAGIIENTPSAFSAAVTANYAIECDLQVTADGEAMVYHDEALGRLTEGSAKLAELSANELRRVAYRACADRIISVGDLCDLVAGRVPLVIELKSRFDGDYRLVARAASILSSYQGPAALMSFDPAQVAVLRQLAPALPRGIVAESYHRKDAAPSASSRMFAYLTQLRRSRPQFIAYSVQDLPAALPLAARKLFGMPLLTWTVRTPADLARAKRYADQIIFERLRP